MRRLAALALTVVLAGCGTGPDPAPATMATALAKVDRLVVAKDYAAARVALEDLVIRTTAAREAGTIDEQRADRVIAAAARLAAALPRPVVTPSATPSPKAEGERDEDDEDGGDGKGKGKKRD